MAFEVLIGTGMEALIVKQRQSFGAPLADGGVFDVAEYASDLASLADFIVKVSSCIRRARLHALVSVEELLTIGTITTQARIHLSCFTSCTW